MGSSSEISEQLGVKPSYSTSCGGVKKIGAAEREEWIYDGSERDGYREEWNSLDDALIFILSSVENFRDRLSQVLDEAEGIWWCGHFQSSFDGGPQLLPLTLRRLGEYNLPLFIDTYFSPE
jgi:hypothetical protein